MSIGCRSTKIAAYCPQFKPENLAPVEIVDDGETLATLPDKSLDFVIANHMVEHSEDPIGTLKNHLRVLKPGGVLFWALPDMSHTFDRHRSLTTVEHLLRDYQQGPEDSRLEHCVEWARLVDRVPEVEVAEKGRQFCEARINIHFHVLDKGDLCCHARLLPDGTSVSFRYRKPDRQRFGVYRRIAPNEINGQDRVCAALLLLPPCRRNIPLQRRFALQHRRAIASQAQVEVRR